MASGSCIDGCCEICIESRECDFEVDSADVVLIVWKQRNLLKHGSWLLRASRLQMPLGFAFEDRMVPWAMLCLRV